MEEKPDENNDTESESELLLDLDISTDGRIRPFMFEPQHSSSSQEEDLVERNETNEDTTDGMSTTRSRLDNRDWCLCRNCQIMTTENESICCQEMNELGDRLDLEGTYCTF